MAAKRKGIGPITETSDIGINIKSSKSIKSEKRIPSPISDTGDQFDTPAWSGSPTRHLLHPERETRMPESSGKFTRKYQEWFNNGSQPYTSWTNIDWSKKLKRSHSNYMPSKKPQPQEAVVESDKSSASTDTEAEDNTQAEQDYVKALVDKYAVAKKPQDGDVEPEPVEKPVKKKRVGTPKQIEHLKGAREKAVIVRKQLAEKRRREEAEQKEKDEQNCIVKEAMRLQELEKQSKALKKKAGTIKADNVKGDVVENVDGVFSIRDLTTSNEKINITKDKVTEEEELSVVFPPKETLVAPLVQDFEGIKLQHDETMKVMHNMLGIDYQDPLYLNMLLKLDL
ncbi:hypothetical protein PhCBS80983_g06339 [Powellomyces hirtus]|uniref:Uncharacterized protein n=1 Tax=Powellomyces hirtus TaxID=109895 RepID=A0A507DNE9_9FUNG|nr:hypothetical protein PhCBS80983_g06339 [Powellomyces hirtus]